MEQQPAGAQLIAEPRPTPVLRWLPRSTVTVAPDLLAVSLLVLLTALVAWNRFTFDSWLGRHDLLAFFLPWYHALGERLRAFDAPGWNPDLFGGAPFAGDPESGWMYLPAMLAFPFLPAAAAFKAMIVLQLLVAGLSTYALARVLGMGAVASLVGAVVFEFGPFLSHNTDCCTVRAQVATFIPLALLGVELSLRPVRWRDRIVPWFIGGFAISQVLAGWLGQGALDALLLIAAYVAYRGLLSPPGPHRALLPRVTTTVASGLAVLAIGLLLGAAGVLPRLDVNAETNLAGANYDALGQAHAATPYTPAVLFANLTGDGLRHRPVAIGGAALILVLLALPLARRRYAVPYFAGLTVVVYALTQAWTPLHPLFFLIPRFQALHEHSPHQINAIVLIGPAMLSAATVEALPRYRGLRGLIPLAFLPLLIVEAIALWLASSDVVPNWAPVLSATVVTALVVLVLATPPVAPARSFLARLARYAPILILTVAFIQPTGQELVVSLLGRTPPRSITPFSERESTVQYAVDLSLDPHPSDGPGAFLQSRQATEPPFRYVGYGGITYPGDGPWRYSYQARRLQPDVLQLLVNARSMVLGLQDIQGYNPIQLKRYVEFMTALNGTRQNYHHANLLPGGTLSPMLDLLNVRYFVIDNNLAQDRYDVVALTTGRPAVYASDQVAIYENPYALPRAWIVHNVAPIQRGQGLQVLANGILDPRLTALVEGEAPPVSQPTDPAADNASITHYEADAIEIDTSTDAPGLLVLSEIYSEGWKAEVDGESVAVLPTDHALRGVPIPAGQHQVRLTYQPASLQIGLILTGITIVAMFAVFAWAGWRRWRYRRFRQPASAAP